MLAFRNIKFLGFSHSQGTGGVVVPPSYEPKLDFSDDRNSQYVGVVL